MSAPSLAELYGAERARLLLLAAADTPAGEYASPVFGDGAVRTPLLLLGEAPGAEETRLSRPFVGKAGKQLTALLAHAGLSREKIFLTNTVKYRPVVRTARGAHNRTPGRKEIAEALPLLAAELAAVSPALLVTLGNTPLSAVLTLADEAGAVISAVHGVPRSICISGRALTLFPLYHPASGIYNPSLVAVMERDAGALREHLVKQALYLSVCDKI